MMLWVKILRFFFIDFGVKDVHLLLFTAVHFDLLHHAIPRSKNAASHQGAGSRKNHRERERTHKTGSRNLTEIW